MVLYMIVGSRLPAAVNYCLNTCPNRKAEGTRFDLSLMYNAINLMIPLQLHFPVG
jgi:hypothetical protein